MALLTDWVSSYDGVLTVISTVVIAISSLITVFLTFYLFRENRLLRRAGTDPNVVAFLTTDKRHPSVVNFAVANLGKGTAKEIEVRIDAHEEDFKLHKVRLNTNGRAALVKILVPDQRMETFFGVGHELFNDSKLKPFRAVVKYSDLEGRSFHQTFDLDVSQFDWLIGLGAPPEHEIAESLKSIAKELKHIFSGTGRLKVETATRNQIRQEQEEALEKRRRDRQENESSGS